MRYCCMFEIMTIHMHKLVKISGIVNRQPWNRLNSYAAHSVFWAQRKQDGVQIMSWRYSVYPGTLVWATDVYEINVCPSICENQFIVGINEDYSARYLCLHDIALQYFANMLTTHTTDKQLLVVPRSKLKRHVLGTELSEASHLDKVRTIVEHKMVSSETDPVALLRDVDRPRYCR